MKNFPSQVLKNEHDVIVQMYDIVTALNRTWEENTQDYINSVTQMIRFFREYSDRYHHYKEETILFEELRRHPDFTLGELVDVLEEHHVLFREYTREIIDMLQSGSFPEAQNILQKYIAQLMDHIAVEDEELFGLADHLFSEQELERIYFQFQDVDRELGVELKKDLERIPINMQKVFTKN